MKRRADKRMPLVVTKIDRSAQQFADTLANYGVATVYEAQGRKGLLDAKLRPIYRPASIAGTAITCEVAPGDNWMIHVAVEQCQAGDVLGPGVVMGRDTLWVSPLVGPPTPVGVGSNRVSLAHLSRSPDTRRLSD